MSKKIISLAFCFIFLFSFRVSAAAVDESWVPLRSTAESYGATVAWNEAERSATVTFGGVTATVSANGGEAEIKDDMMLVPFEFITGLERASKPEEQRELYDLARAWATAFCNRDGRAMLALSADEETFLETGGGMADGVPVFGLSSPWPWFENEAKVIIDGDNVSCVFLFRTSASVEARRFDLSYIETEDGLKISGAEEFADDQSQASSVPTIKSVELLDKDGTPLPVTDGWVNLRKDNIISVTFEGKATHVDFFTVPTGTETFLEQRIIGRTEVVGNENKVRFEWEAPGSFLGYIWVIVYNGDVARTSDMGEFFIKAIYDQP